MAAFVEDGVSTRKGLGRGIRNKKCTETKNVTTKWDRPSKRQRQHRHVQERSEFELEPEPASDCHFEGKHRTPLGNFPSDILQNIKDNNDNGYDGDNSSDQVNGILIPAAESCPNTDDDPRSLPSIDQLDAVDGSVDSQPDHGDLPEFMHPQFALTWSLESARMLDDLECCARCDRLQTDCYYPIPPDRKRLAQTRALTRRRRVNSLLGFTIASGSQASRPENCQRGDVQTPYGNKAPTDAISNIAQDDRDISDHVGFFAPSTASQWPTMLLTETDDMNIDEESHDSAPLPPQHLGHYLFNTLFSHYRPASLILNESETLQDYTEGKLPYALTAAIFALATRLLDDAQDVSNSGTLTGPMTQLKIVCSRADTWAHLADELTLMWAHLPSLRTVQTCEILATYWFAVGQVAKAKMHLHAAYIAARTLGYHNIGDRLPSHTRPSDQETGRMCFWNCWIVSFVIFYDGFLAAPFNENFSILSGAEDIVQKFALSRQGDSLADTPFSDDMKLGLLKSFAI
ncbi:fungal specific transcription factor domain-containing protein [Aspergillus tanneri]|uniref:Xylanolytic transcriptional activator regulatory domain-containing protein n=1 Tax=Aspergillus tanneri TaxID=1220188 RepID=A0A5M9N3V6_9EURO|nr:uncharacterized protein ATNIH1004_000781 [Aspergillus tanneri]KAA8651883.1 hypothetical protein ATNIH1004_000781 [Aspergillus tanneri]